MVVHDDHGKFIGVPMQGGTNKECLELCEQNTVCHNISSLPDHQRCEAVYDNFLCWFATPSEGTARQQCPPLKYLVPDVLKECTANGTWHFTDQKHKDRTSGYTDYLSYCVTEEMRKIASHLNIETGQKADRITTTARYFEYCGLCLSILALLIAIIIFSYSRQLQFLRIKLHKQLLISILLMLSVRLIIYGDKAVTENDNGLIRTGTTLTTTKGTCEFLYILLEYLKSVVYQWMIIEGYYLHNVIAVKVFGSEPKLWVFVLVGWLLPVFHIGIWLVVEAWDPESGGTWIIPSCLTDYFMKTAFYWVLNFVHLLRFLVNLVFIINIIRILRSKVDDPAQRETEYFKRSVRAACMLIPLLGIPNIFQVIPFVPSTNNIFWWGVYTFAATFFYMFQGLFIAIIYCFRNQEVQRVLKQEWSRYKMQHASFDNLRRGSHAVDRISTPANSQNHIRRYGVLKVTAVNRKPRCHFFACFHRNRQDKSPTPVDIAVIQNGNRTILEKVNDRRALLTSPSSLQTPTPDTNIQSPASAFHITQASVELESPSERSTLLKRTFDLSKRTDGNSSERQRTKIPSEELTVKSNGSWESSKTFTITGDIPSASLHLSSSTSENFSAGSVLRDLQPFCEELDIKVAIASPESARDDDLDIAAYRHNEIQRWDI